jgi:hypothetical protein
MNELIEKEDNEGRLLRNDDNCRKKQNGESMIDIKKKSKKGNKNKG